MYKFEEWPILICFIIIVNLNKAGWMDGTFPTVAQVSAVRPSCLGVGKVDAAPLLFDGTL